MKKLTLFAPVIAVACLASLSACTVVEPVPATTTTVQRETTVSHPAAAATTTTTTTGTHY